MLSQKCAKLNEKRKEKMADDILGYITINQDHFPNGLEVNFAALHKPVKKSKKGKDLVYRVTLKLTPEEAGIVAGIMEPFLQQIDAMFPETKRDNPFKPEKDGDKHTGNFLLTFYNAFPVRVWTPDGEEYDPIPAVGKGSRVFINFAVLPYEFNGEHGIARSRLSDVQVIKLVEFKASPFARDGYTPKPRQQQAPAAPGMVPPTPRQMATPTPPPVPGMAPPTPGMVPPQPTTPVPPTAPPVPGVPPQPAAPAAPGAPTAPPVPPVPGLNK
jgi:hypothetical protein